MLIKKSDYDDMVTLFEPKIFNIVLPISLNICFENPQHMFWLRNKKRTSDGGNGNHSVSLPIILIKNKVDQKFSSSYTSLLLVFIL